MPDCWDKIANVVYEGELVLYTETQLTAMTLDQKLQLWIALGAWISGLGSFAAVFLALHLARGIQKVRLRVELSGRRVRDKENEYVFVIAVSNLSNFPIVIKDLRFVVSDTRLNWKGRRQLRFSRFMSGWDSGVPYVKFELGAHCPLTIPSNSTVPIEEEMPNSLIVDEKWLLAYLRLENGADAFSNNYACGDILDSFEIYTANGETSRQAAKAIVAFGKSIGEYEEWQRQNPGMTIFPHKK